MFINSVLRIALILFSISTTTHASVPKFLKSLTNINEADIQGGEILPLPVPDDARHYKFPTRVIPFKIKSRNTLGMFWAPLDVTDVYHDPQLKRQDKIKINAYLTLPENLDIKSQCAPCAVLLHTSNGLGPTDYEIIKRFNDEGIAFCIIEYAHKDRGGVDRGCVKKFEEFNPLMPAIDTHFCLELLKNVPFLNKEKAVMGLSLGGTAAIEASHEWLGKAVSEVCKAEAKQIDENSKSKSEAMGSYESTCKLYISIGGILNRQYPNNYKSTPDSLVVAFHGEDEKYALLDPLKNFFQFSGVKGQLRIIKEAGHYYWARDLTQYTHSPAHRHHYNKENKFAPSPFVVEVHPKEKKIVYKNFDRFSKGACILKDLNQYDCPAEVYSFLHAKQEEIPAKLPELKHCLLSQPRFAERQQEIKSASADELMSIIFIEYLQSAKVMYAGSKAYAQAEELTPSQLRSKITKENLEIQLNPTAWDYTFKETVSLIKEFCKPWQEKEYLRQAELTSRNKFRANGDPVNIVTVDAKEFNPSKAEKALKAKVGAPAAQAETKPLMPNYGVIEDTKALIPPLPLQALEDLSATDGLKIAKKSSPNSSSLFSASKDYSISSRRLSLSGGASDFLRRISPRRSPISSDNNDLLKNLKPVSPRCGSSILKDGSDSRLLSPRCSADDVNSNDPFKNLKGISRSCSPVADMA